MSENERRWIRESSMVAENGACEEERRDGESCWKENAPQSMARGGMGPGKAERGEAGRSGAGRDGRTAPRGVERGRREWNSPLPRRLKAPNSLFLTQALSFLPKTVCLVSWNFAWLSCDLGFCRTQMPNPRFSIGKMAPNDPFLTGNFLRLPKTRGLAPVAGRSGSTTNFLCLPKTGGVGAAGHRERGRRSPLLRRSATECGRP